MLGGQCFSLGPQEPGVGSPGLRSRSREARVCPHCASVILALLALGLLSEHEQRERAEPPACLLSPYPGEPQDTLGLPSPSRVAEA